MTIPTLESAAASGKRYGVGVGQRATDHDVPGETQREEHPTVGQRDRREPIVGLDEDRREPGGDQQARRHQASSSRLRALSTAEG